MVGRLEITDGNTAFLEPHKHPTHPFSIVGIGLHPWQTEYEVVSERSKKDVHEAIHLPLALFPKNSADLIVVVRCHGLVDIAKNPEVESLRIRVAHS